MFLDFIAGGAAGVAHVSVWHQLPYYDRGVACACPSDAMDLIEAHKWFNLAAMIGGVAAASASRANINADDRLCLFLRNGA